MKNTRLIKTIACAGMILMLAGCTNKDGEKKYLSAIPEAIVSFFKKDGKAKNKDDGKSAKDDKAVKDDKSSKDKGKTENKLKISRTESFGGEWLFYLFFWQGAVGNYSGVSELFPPLSE